MTGGRQDDRETDRSARVLADALRQHVEQVPPDIAQRLAQVRRAAVAELAEREGSRRRGWPLRLAGGFAGAAAAVALTVALLTERREPSDAEPLLLAHADELAAIAELEMLEELEFLAWLEQHQDEIDAGQG